MGRILLIQPREGAYNRFHVWVPLSLVSISSGLFREGYEVDIVDQRLDPSWRGTLERFLQKDPLCVGITSKTGSQIYYALEASEVVKNYGTCPVVWGGVHATLFPSQTLSDCRVDIVVRGEGERTFYELVKALEGGSRIDGINGISYRRDRTCVSTPDRRFSNMDDLPPMAYEMVDIEPYIHPFYGEERVIEIETSRGCPYSCGFCYSPSYHHRQWRALSAQKVLDLLQGLVERYGLRSFHFIDDAFFVDRQRTQEIMEGILHAGLKINFGFQGATIRDLLRMDSVELSLLQRAGCRFLQFGVESGSSRILGLIAKDVESEEVLELNRRLKAYPQIYPYYNFICGFPTETQEEVLMSAQLAWRLLEENPMTLISPFHHYTPYPGTPLFDLARQDGHLVPSTPEDWRAYDWTTAASRNGSPHTRFLKNIEVASIFVDRKVSLISRSRLYRMMAWAYRPIARFRMSRSFYSLMPEARAYQWLVS